jgi:hypothetical protein
VTLARRLASALEAAASDPGTWPLGMLGFLARGGLIVLALPILTLPTPVGIATLLGPQVISTGRFEGRLLGLVAVWAVALLGIVIVATTLAALAQDRLHARLPPADAAATGHTLLALIRVEALAIAPIGVVLAVSLSSIVGEVRLVARTAVPLGALAVAVLISEAIDGTLSRRVLVSDRAARPPARGLMSVVATAALGWAVTLIVLLPGLAVIAATWQAARVAWSRMPTAMMPPTSVASPDIALAVVATLAMVAVWVGIVLLCGLASVVRAHLWTSRARRAGDWTEVGH